MAAAAAGAAFFAPGAAFAFGALIVFARARRGAGTAVVAVFVEELRLRVAILLAHVDLELARGAAPLPAVITIAQVAPRREAAAGERPRRRMPHVQVSE